MNRKALILHCMGLNRDPHKQLWYEELKNKLEHLGYEVELPILPEVYFGQQTTEGLANRYNYLINAYKIRTGIDVVIGHSIGGALGLYMAQYIPIKTLILVGPYVPPHLNYDVIKALTTKINLIYEKKDPFIPIMMIEQLILDMKDHELRIHQEKSQNHLITLSTEMLINIIETDR